ncbi:MAG: TonB family protein [Mesorhizobium sp.]|nr:MAG: TonB family protein [Mesorhizobium sp.]RWM43819.1 MAG: TonB family protein [Mesorhizobium sp.]RWM57835.1 MAG: TonB family protein [Mesorhizobium sp.]RWM59185.1 MAG: TonB family protein [Mesorhizobium sp.]RWM97611.1 MAG: TonB family protein [Mesorhizobium sp.]
MQKISPLPDPNGELTIAPTEPLAPVRPSAMSRKWTAAIIASCLFHVVVAAAFLIAPGGTFDSKDAIQMEGTDQTGANVVGSDLDGQAPGAMNVTLVPDPQPAKPEVKPEPPADRPTGDRPIREMAEQPPAPLPQIVKQPTAAPDILMADTPRLDEQSVAPKIETPAEPAAPAQSTEAPPADIGQPPIPTPRPSATPGLGGTGETNEARGAADGEERDAVTSSTGKKQAAAGNAIESRYSGEVQKKLARANRRVSKSIQASARNNARVVFVVMADGSISDIQLAESSGSAELDQFALTLVRKQAPFPPIPSETGRSSWVFKARIGPF